MSAPNRERREPKCHRPKGVSRRDELEVLAESEDERTALMVAELLDLLRDEPDQAPHTGGALNEAD